MIRDWFSGEDVPYNDFVKALLLNDIEAMNEFMNDIALTTFSSFDIAESAAKQSGRMIVPKVEPVVSFSHGCLQMQKLEVGLIPYELTRGMEETRRTLARIRPGMEIGIMIGPEGGFDVEEVKEAVNAKICPITLGRRILRTETAGMAALAVLMFLLEDS